MIHRNDQFGDRLYIHTPERELIERHPDSTCRYRDRMTKTGGIFRRSGEDGTECEHGWDVCPQCHACTCTDVLGNKVRTEVEVDE